MRKILVVFMALIFLINLASAAILTTHTYKDNDLKVEFGYLNLEWIGVKTGEAVLKSHSSTSEILKTGYGKEEVVMFYDFDFSEVQTDGLGKVYFKDMNMNEEISKEFKFVYWTNISYDKPIVKQVCTLTENKTEICHGEIEGYEKAFREDWADYNSYDIPDYPIRIGLKTMVNKGDYMDAQWTIINEKIDRHAEWSAGLDTGLEGWWTMNETTGDAIDISGNGDDLVEAGTVPSQTGVNDKARGVFSGSNYLVDQTVMTFDDANDYSISFWMYQSTAGTTIARWVNVGNGLASGFYCFFGRDEGDAGMDVKCKGATSYELLIENNLFPANDWVHVAFIYYGNNKSGELYMNGTYIGTDTITTAGASAQEVSVGAREDGVQPWTQGYIDEVGVWNRTLTLSEITDLYNSGDAINPLNVSGGGGDTTDPLVTLNSPEPYANLTNPSVTFNCTASDNVNLTNVTLYIDSILNETDTTVANNTAVTFSKTIAEGYHNWTCEAYDNSSNSYSANERYFNMSYPVDAYPTITQNSPENYANFSTSDVDLNCTGTDGIDLDKVGFIVNGINVYNDTDVVNNTPVLYDTPVYDVDGVYNWSCFAEDNASQITYSSTRYFTVDTTSPIITPPGSPSLTYPQGLGVDFDANEDIDTWLVNDSVNFQINSTGYLNNITTLGAGNYSLNISANDTLGNENSTVFEFSINPAIPNGSISGTTPIEEGTLADVEGTENNSGDGGCTYNLYRDGILVSNPDTSELITGSYDYVYNTSGCTNYSANSSLDTFTMVVSNQRTYDNHNDADLNWSLWSNSTSGSASYFDIYESSGIMTIYLHGDAAADKTVSVSIASTEFPNYNLIENVTLKTDIDSYAWTCAGGVLDFFGQDFNLGHNGTSFSYVWTFIRNGTDFDAFRDSIYNKTFTPSDSIVGIHAACTITPFSPVRKLYTSLDYEYYVLSSELTITINNPDDGEHVFNENNVSFNFTALSPNYNLTNATLYIDDVLNETIGLSGIADTEAFSKNLSSETFGNHTFKFEVCNSNGCSFSETRSFMLQPFGYSANYSSETEEGNLEDFTLEIEKGDGVNINSVVMHYDTLTDTASLFSSGDNITAVSSIIIPGVGADTNKSFYFEITLDDDSVYNTTNFTQAVSNIEIDDCGSQPNLFLTLNLADENSKDSINGTIEVYLSVINNVDYSEVLSYNGTFSNVSSKTFCSALELNQTDFLLNAEIKYYSDNYASELYFIQRADLSEYPKELYLYDLDSNSSTTFKVTYQDDTLVAIDGAVVQLLRKYIGSGSYEVVEAPITSNLGATVLHVDLDSNIYKVIVVKDGEVLDTFNNVIFVCDSILTGECTHKLLGSINPQNEFDYDTERDFVYSILSNNETVTVTYSVPSSTPSTVNIQLTQKDQFGNSTLCNQTIVSSAGSIECDVEETIGESYLELAIYKDGVPIAKATYIVPETGGIDFLGNNYIIIVILILSLVGMAFTSPEWIVINAILTMFLSGMLWLANGINFVMGLGLLMWLVMGAGILISKLSKQEDR